MTWLTNSRSLLPTSIVAGVYSLVVCGLLVGDATRRLTKIPLDSPEFLAVKEEFLKDPTNESVKESIRQLDFTLREEYFREQRFTRTGVGMLLTGIIVMLVTGKAMAARHRIIPRPELKGIGPDSDERLSLAGPPAVAVVGVALVVTIWAMWAARPSRLPESLDALAALRSAPDAERDGHGAPARDGAGGEPIAPNAGSKNAGVRALPSREEYLRSWPRFRGPGGAGVSSHANVPTQWNGAAGEGIVWKTAVPLPGVSSPIVWKDRVFLTGATAERRVVYCFDAADGRIVWEKEVAGGSASTEPTKVSADTGHAAPTMATDGRFVYSMFASGDIAGFDQDGNQLWHTALGPLKNTYGHAASLDTFNEWVVAQVDHGKPNDALSKVMAFDGATGRVVWQAVRKMASSWSSPAVIEHAGRFQVLTSGEPWVIGYAAKTGEELWRANCLRGAEIGPSPVYSDGLAFAVNENAKLAAIRVDGTGDVTESHVAWEATEGLPDACSPLATDRLLLVLASFGTLTCYDKAKGGDPKWEEDFEEDFTSSPSLVGDTVYLFAKSGKAWIVRPTPEACERVGEADLGEACVTSPAFQDGTIFIRGETHLFRIGGP